MRDFESNDGERRTRTADTTIFSRARRPAQDGGIPGTYAVSAGTPRSPDVRSLRIVIAVCGNGGRVRPKLRLALCGQETGGQSLSLARTRRAHSLFRGGGMSSAPPPTTASRPGATAWRAFWGRPHPVGERERCPVRRSANKNTCGSHVGRRQASPAAPRGLYSGRGTAAFPGPVLATSGAEPRPPDAAGAAPVRRRAPYAG